MPNCRNLFLLMFVLVVNELQGQNLFQISNLGEVRPAPSAALVITLAPVEIDHNYYIRASCQNTTWTPGVHLKELDVRPGDVYTVFIETVLSDSLNANMSIEAGDVNVVWPGPKLITGINRVTYTIPAGVTRTQIGFAFVKPKEKEFVLIKEVGIFKGNVDESEWIANKGDGLQRLLIPSKRWLLWLLFPAAILILLGLYFYDTRVRRASI